MTQDGSHPLVAPEFSLALRCPSLTGGRPWEGLGVHPLEALRTDSLDCDGEKINGECSLKGSSLAPGDLSLQSALEHICGSRTMAFRALSFLWPSLMDKGAGAEGGPYTGQGLTGPREQSWVRTASAHGHVLRTRLRPAHGYSVHMRLRRLLNQLPLCCTQGVSGDSMVLSPGAPCQPSAASPAPSCTLAALTGPSLLTNMHLGRWGEAEREQESEAVPGPLAWNWVVAA